MTRSKAFVIAGAAATVACYAVLAWHRRWVCDDGLIAIRTVRELLAGNGPVFNAYERAEANTSTLWTYLLAFVGFLTHLNVTRIAVFTGLLLAITGVALGLDAARRWQRDRGVHGLLVPCGALVILATSAAWDFATSGLETGLEMAWLSLAWWLLVTLRPESPRQPLRAMLLGLGPLVRPDFALVSAVFLLAWWWLLRPPLRRTAMLLGCAIALPVAYEVFRAGYYGMLVPLPALAKSATRAYWDRGLAYAVNFARPYWLWLPLAALLVAAIAARPRGRDLVLIAAPVGSALLLALFVTRVGGDFMHARMLLPSLFLVVLPAFLVPTTRRALMLVGVIAAWALVTWHQADSHRSHGSGYVEDERYGYMRYTHREHPDDDAAYLDASPTTPLVADAIRNHRRVLISEGGVVVPLAPAVPMSIGVVAGRLGTGGLLAPLDGIAVDTLGLANPIGARIPVNYPDEAVGHQKGLPWVWIFADFGDPAQVAGDDIVPAQLEAARRALRCGDLAELMASVREPMSPGRFWKNLKGSLRRTRLQIPEDPVAAELEFCGSTRVPHVTASSTYERWGWGVAELIDGRRTSSYGHLGFSTMPSTVDHAEWIELALPAPSTATKLVLHPRGDQPGKGFPVDFTIETWSDGRWVQRVERHGVEPPTTPQTFDLGGATTRVRIAASHLQNVDGSYVFQLAEAELVP